MTGDAGARDAFARDVLAVLRPQDAVAVDLDIRIEAAGMGWCRLSMQVRPEMLNGAQVCHGGYIFSLADTAMAYASNSANVTALAQHAQISFIAPGLPDEKLTAEAREVSKAGRNGLYDVEVRGADGRMVAAFRGATRNVRGRPDPSRGDPPA